MAEPKVQDLQKEILQLQKQKDELLNVNAALTEQVENLEQQITAIKSAGVVKPAEKPKPVLPTEIFTVDKLDYLFTIPAFIWEGQQVEAKAALKDKDLLAQLVKIGFGGIKRKGE